MIAEAVRKAVPKGFTLIELLIVVAIIAILAAIAVPNFLEAQTRSKISRVRADLRSAATALEAYKVDNNHYPPTPLVSGGDVGVLRVLPDFLSTPVAYISTANLIDPFILKTVGDYQGLTRTGVVVSYGPSRDLPRDPGGDRNAGKRYYYHNNFDFRRDSFGPYTDGAIAAREVQGHWIVGSLGPDETRSLLNVHPTRGAAYAVNMPYDATNGTISDGDIVRTQRKSEGGLSD